jgi:formamidopyrimidine-DNA glycosylase
MPELPEVETIRRDLDRALTGTYIETVHILDSKLAAFKQEALWQKTLTDRQIMGFSRKGKYLGILVEPDNRVVIHLRMTGQLLLLERDKVHPRTRLAFRLKDGRWLVLADVRRFAECWLQKATEPWPAKSPLGPDALEEATTEHFAQALHARRTPIHNALLDQRVLAGVGNIYSQEALFLAGIRPTRRSDRLTRQQRATLFKEIQNVLRKALDSRGSSLQDYRDVQGDVGEAQAWHAVYDKTGRACIRCESILKSVRLAGRTAVYCWKCQS